MFVTSSTPWPRGICIFYVPLIAVTVSNHLLILILVICQQHGMTELFAVFKINDASSIMVAYRLHTTRIMTYIYWWLFLFLKKDPAFKIKTTALQKRTLFKTLSSFRKSQKPPSSYLGFDLAKAIVTYL